MSLPGFQDLRANRRLPGDPVLRERDERLESLKAVTGKLAHDFNNFLAPTYGYLTLLKDEMPAGSTAALYVNSMDTAAQKAEGYVSSILLGMRPYRQFAPREFPLDVVVHELVEQWKATAPEPGSIDVRTTLEPFAFVGDEKQWRVVVDQLLSNARYALAMGGQLEISLTHHTLTAPEIERLGLVTDQVGRLQFRDNGFGMSPDVARRAFEPFFTTRTQIKAAGLGLTMVHGITLFHGGQVELATVEDGGTTITLWIPARNVGQTERSASPPVPNPKLRSRPRVLLLADDPLLREVLRSWISSQELEPDTAADESEARRALQRPGGPFVLVISETDLKSGRGEDLYHALSETTHSVPWVFLSGRRAPDFTGVRGRDLPLVMKKPFTHRAFSEVLRKYTSRS